MDHVAERERTAGAQPSGRIFISYRRQETSYPAGWLFDRLVDHYGDGQVFKDVDSVEPGDDFVEVIRNAVGSCEVLLALIGAQWATITDAEGRRRLDRSDDFVRLEIEVALERNIRVIPILVDGASLPSVEELPATLVKLVRRQTLELSPSRFEYDTNRLLKILNKTLGGGAGDGPTADADLGAGTEPEDAHPIVDPPVRPRPVLLEAPPDPAPPTPPDRPGDAGAPARHRGLPLAASLGAAGMAVVAISGLLVWSGSGSDPRPPPGTTDPAAGVTTATTSTKASPGPQAATIKVGRGPSGVAVGPGDVWVSNDADGTVARLDPASGRVLTTIPVGKTGGDIVACPDAVWVKSDSRFIARIDAASGQVTRRFPIGTEVRDLAVHCGQAVWASGADGSISRIAEGATTAETFLSSTGDLADVDVDAQGGLWMTDPRSDAVVRVDPATKKVQRLAVGGEPIGITASQFDAVWVTDADAGTVLRIDPTSNTVVRTLPVGKRPWGAAAGLGALWVTNIDGDSVSRVDIPTGTVTTIAVGSKPDGIAVGHGAVWVANGGSGTVSRIA